MDPTTIERSPRQQHSAPDSTMIMGASEAGERSLRDEPSTTKQENLVSAHESHQASPRSDLCPGPLVLLQSPEETTPSAPATASTEEESAEVEKEVVLLLPPAHDPMHSDPDVDVDVDMDVDMDVDAEAEVCCICLDPFTQVDPAITTRCQHRFHLQCSECWLQRSRNCPLCWKPLRYEWDAPEESQTLAAAVTATSPTTSPTTTFTETSTPVPLSARQHSHFRHRNSTTTPHRPVATLGSFLCKIGSSLWKQLNSPSSLGDASPPTQQET